MCSSPGLIAAYHVLHRLSAPRHPPYTLSNLTALILLPETCLIFDNELENRNVDLGKSVCASPSRRRGGQSREHLMLSLFPAFDSRRPPNIRSLRLQKLYSNVFAHVVPAISRLQNTQSSIVKEQTKIVEFLKSEF